MIMIDKDFIKSLAKERLRSSDSYPVDISVSPDNLISVEIDNDNGVSIDECVALSRYIEENLDREKEDFELEVGSSGITSPFKIVRQYVKNLGNEVEMLLKNGTKLIGILKNADDHCATITVEKKIKPDGSKRRTTIEEDQTYSYDEIKYTKYLIRF
jgi:ribosome maturation factor RimP